MLDVSTEPSAAVPVVLIGVRAGSPSHGFAGGTDQLSGFIEGELTGAEILARLTGSVLVGSLLLVLLM